MSDTSSAATPPRVWTSRWWCACTLGVASAVVVWLVPGCRREAAQELHPVKGRVTLDDAPLDHGSLTLRPNDSDSWDHPTGMIRDDGTYDVYTNGKAGAPPGTYRVVAFVTEDLPRSDGAAHPGMPESIIPARYNDPERTPLRLEVTASPVAGTYDLRLTSDGS